MDYNSTMTNEQKAQVYNQLMVEYTKLQNRVSSIKGESITLDQNQINQIQDLENKMRFIMESVARL
jgi:peptidoglycan hydrolase-like amidase